MLHLRRRVAVERLGALEMAGLAAFMCDTKGRIIESTRFADVLMDREGWLRLVDHRLEIRDNGRRPDLESLLARGGGAILLRSESGTRCVLELTPIPSADTDFPHDAAAIVVARVASVGPDAASRLSRTFGLSSAEAEIALSLLTGGSPEQIARDRNVAIGTVRAQIRSLYARLDVNSQLAFSSVIRLAL